MVAEKYITRAKENNLANRRLIAKTLAPQVVTKLFAEIAPAQKDRQGGYTRIIKMGPRKSDSARMAIIELVK